MKCIYCLQDKPLNEYKKREHVIPQCFGRFSPDNLVLHKCVCDECNQYFGDELELFLGRDSYESMERQLHGIEPKKVMKNKKRVKSKIKDGIWNGVILEDTKADKPGEIGIEPSLQAGFYNKLLNGYVYYVPKDIPSSEQLEKDGYDLKKTIWMFGDDSEIPILIEILKNKGIDISIQNDFINQTPPEGSVLVESEVTIDKTISRALSKIAFNYLAYVTGGEVALRDEFNGIRWFIRYGEGDPREYFSVNASPILHDDQITKYFKSKSTQGHLINIDWRKSNIVSKVSPFNSNTYAVLLCTNYEGLWFPIKSGHHFDTKTKIVSKLLAISKEIIINRY